MATVLQARVRVLMISGEHSEWSSWFSLDAVGSEGVFTCKLPSGQGEYQVRNELLFWIEAIITYKTRGYVGIPNYTYLLCITVLCYSCMYIHLKRPAAYIWKYIQCMHCSTYLYRPANERVNNWSEFRIHARGYYNYTGGIVCSGFTKKYIYLQNILCT